MGTINTSMHAVQQAQDDLSELDALPPLGQDMVRVIQHFFFKNIFFFLIFIYLAVPVLIAAHGIFSCGLWDLFP